MSKLEESILKHLNSSNRALLSGELARKVYSDLYNPDIKHFIFLVDKIYAIPNVSSAVRIYCNYHEGDPQKLKELANHFKQWYYNDFIPAFSRVRKEGKVSFVKLKGLSGKKKRLQKPTAIIAAPKGRLDMLEERLEHERKHHDKYIAYREKVVDYCSTRIKKEFPSIKEDDIVLRGSVRWPRSFLTSSSDVDLTIFSDEYIQNLRDKMNQIRNEVHEKFKIDVNFCIHKKSEKPKFMELMQKKQNFKPRIIP